MKGQRFRFCLGCKLFNEHSVAVHFIVETARISVFTGGIKIVGKFSSSSVQASEHIGMGRDDIVVFAAGESPSNGGSHRNRTLFAAPKGEVGPGLFFASAHDSEIIVGNIDHSFVETGAGQGRHEITGFRGVRIAGISSCLGRIIGGFIDCRIVVDTLGGHQNG